MLANKGVNKTLVEGLYYSVSRCIMGSYNSYKVSFYIDVHKLSVATELCGIELIKLDDLKMYCDSLEGLESCLVEVHKGSNVTIYSLNNSWSCILLLGNRLYIINRGWQDVGKVYDIGSLRVNLKALGLDGTAIKIVLFTLTGNI